MKGQERGAARVLPRLFPHREPPKVHLPVDSRCLLLGGGELCVSDAYCGSKPGSPSSSRVPDRSLLSPVRPCPPRLLLSQGPCRTPPVDSFSPPDKLDSLPLLVCLNRVLRVNSGPMGASFDSYVQHTDGGGLLCTWRGAGNSGRRHTVQTPELHRDCAHP